MCEVAGEIPPDTWQMCEILPLAVAFGEAGEDTGDLGITLSAKGCIDEAEFYGVEIGLSCFDARDVVIEKFCFEISTDI